MDDQQDTGAELARDIDAARPPDVVCSGGFRLPQLSAFMPTGDQLTEILRKAATDG
jgi:hypothetical protein